jgi:Tfp pilus assembly protein PilO
VTRRYAVAGAVAFAVVLLFFLVVLKPKFSQVSEVRKQVTAEHSKTDGLKLQLRHLEEAERNQVGTQAQLASLNRALPSTPDLPSIIRLLQQAATNSGMDLQSIAPSPPSAVSNATGVETVNVNLQVNGGFFRLETFLTRLEDLQRVVEVTSISISPSTDPVTGLLTLQSTITFRMYVVQANARVSGVVPRSSAAPAASPTPTTSAIPTPTPSATR